MTIKEIEQKLALHKEVMRMYYEGYKLSAISKKLKMSRQLVWYIVDENLRESDPLGYENGGED